MQLRYVRKRGDADAGVAVPNDAQSMMSAQASVGAAATCPTSGTIFRPADATRHGAATTPQPEMQAAPSRDTASRRRFIVGEFESECRAV